MERHGIQTAWSTDHHLGQTQGRGKLDTRHQYNQPVKNIFVKPLCPDWKAILNR